MDAAVYEQLLKGVEDPIQRGIGGLLAGPSKPITEFVARVRAATCLDSSRSSGKPICVSVIRSVRFRPLDEEVAALCGTGVITPIWIDLQPDSPVFNAASLFGAAQRKGAIELSAGGSLVLRDCDLLNNELIDRCTAHIQMWWEAVQQSQVALPYSLMLYSGAYGGVERLLKSLCVSATIHEIELPRLPARVEDIPFCLHECARRYKHGLADFEPAAVDALVSHSWPADVQELFDFTRGVFFARGGSGRVTTEDVRLGLAYHSEHGGVRDSVRSTQSASDYWVEVTQLCDDCDRYTTQMLNEPFFASGGCVIAVTPLAADWPELAYVRLVSWAYQKFVEGGATNFPIVIRIGAAVSADVDRLRQVFDLIGRLRTFEQHRLEYGSESDTKTRETVYKWLRGGCGSSTPHAEHFERCTLALLRDLRRFLTSLLTVLRAIDRDQYRDLLIAQWRERKESSWPKHKIDAVVSEVIATLNRADLKPAAVAEGLLSECQSQLAVISDDLNRKACLVSWLEKTITERFPLRMPVSGDDLGRLGVTDGRRIGQILKTLRCEFEQHSRSREELLAIAATLVRPEEERG